MKVNWKVYLESVGGRGYWTKKIPKIQTVATTVKSVSQIRSMYPHVTGFYVLTDVITLTHLPNFHTWWLQKFPKLTIVKRKRCPCHLHTVIIRWRTGWSSHLTLGRHRQPRYGFWQEHKNQCINQNKTGKRDGVSKSSIANICWNNFKLKVIYYLM